MTSFFEKVYSTSMNHQINKLFLNLPWKSDYFVLEEECMWQVALIIIKPYATIVRVYDAIFGCPHRTQEAKNYNDKIIKWICTK